MLTYYNDPSIGIPHRLFVLKEIDPDKIPGTKSLAYNMGADKFTLQRKQGDKGIVYEGSFFADSYTGRDIGKVAVENGYAGAVQSYENNFEFGKPKDLDEKLDKSYIV